MHVLLIAYKNLFKEKIRLAITIGGVTFSVVLILLLLGLYLGWSTQVTKFLEGIPADFWVGSEGSSDLSHGISILPRDTLEKLEGLEGVSKVTPFVGRQIGFDINGKEAHFYLISQEEGSVIKPSKIVEGKANPASGEITIDQSFAKDEKLELGDMIKIQDTELKISGISSGGNLLVYSYAIAREDDVRKILNASDYTNYFIVESNDKNLFLSDMKNDLPGLQAIEKSDFMENNAGIVKDTFLPIIAVLTLVAVIIGIAVIGLTIFTSVIEKSREYGVLKAIGYKNGQLFQIAVIQAVFAGLLGLLLGNLLAPLIANTASSFVGGFIYELTAREIAIVSGVVILMSVLASLIPLKKILSIDPAEVFKA